MKKAWLWLFVGCFFVGVHAHATTIVSQDFSGFSLSPTTYTSANSGTVLGSGVGSVTLNIGGSQSASVSSAGLKLIDNDTSVNASAALVSTSSVSTGATGENKIQGYFDFVVNDVTGNASTNPDWVFAVNTAGTVFTSSGLTAIQIVFAGGGTVISYRDNVGQSATLYTLSYSTSYRMTLNADFSSTTQDSYTFSITDLSSGLVVYTSPTINTRTANLSPGSMVWYTGGGATPADADPILTITNMQFSAIPELRDAVYLMLGMIVIFLSGRIQKKFLPS